MRSFRTSVLFRLLAAVSCLGLVAVAQPPPATAGASNLTIVGLDNDEFWNYDFYGQTVDAGNVDWAIDLVFYNNANINKVKNALNPWYSQTGGPKYEYMRDGPIGTFQWDQDSGRKITGCPPTGWFEHYRVYADPSDDSMYNVYYGYYVIGTTHFDYNDGCSGALAGYSETAEGWVAQHSGEAWGTNRVFYSCCTLYNAEAFRTETAGGIPHIWENDGYATYVSVP